MVSSGDEDARASLGPGILPSARNLVRGWRWVIRARLADHSPYLVVARRRHPLEVATEETELLIDGFPRSGNTFAVVAFQLAQPAPVRVSHHIHSSAHLIAAAKRGIPIIVTVRKPEEAVLSCIIREPYVTIAQALRAYTAFYQRLLGWREQMVVAEFHRITTDFGGVTQQVNERFGTSFLPFAQTPENVAECFEIIEDRARRPPWDGLIGAFLAGAGTIDAVRAAAHRDGEAGRGPHVIPENRVARPSPGRDARKRALRAAYGHPRLAGLEAQAREIYERFASS